MMYPLDDTVQGC